MNIIIYIPLLCILCSPTTRAVLKQSAPADCDEQLLWDETSWSLLPGSQLYGDSQDPLHPYEDAVIEPAEDCTYWQPLTAGFNYFQARLPQRSYITRITRRGLSTSCPIKCYVISLGLLFSNDTFYWDAYRKGTGLYGAHKEFISSEKNDNLATVTLDPPGVGQYIRFIPLSASSDDLLGRSCMRVQVYGCPTETNVESCPVKLRSAASTDNDPLKTVKFGINGKFDDVIGLESGIGLYVIDTTTSPCSLVSGPDWYGTATSSAEADRLVDTLTGLNDGLWVAGLTRESFGVHISQNMRDHFRDVMGMELGLPGLRNPIPGDKLAFVYQIGSRVSAQFRYAEFLTGGIQHLVDLVTDTSTACLHPLGMYTGEITQSQITTSSFFYLSGDKSSQQSKIRPFSNYGGGIMIDVWMPEEASRWQAFVQVDLGTVYRVIALGIVGSEQTLTFIKSFWMAQGSPTGMKPRYTQLLNISSLERPHETWSSADQPMLFPLVPHSVTRYMKLYNFDNHAWLGRTGFSLEFFGCPRDDVPSGIDFTTAAIPVQFDDAGTAVTVEETCTYGFPGCFSVCVTDSATWWEADLGRLHYIRGVALDNTAGLISTAADGTPDSLPDMLPFRAYGSRGGIKWIGVSDRMKFRPDRDDSEPPPVTGVLVWTVTPSAIIRVLHVTDFNTALDGACVQITLKGKKAPRCPYGSVFTGDKCYSAPGGGTDTFNYNNACEDHTWIGPGMPNKPKGRQELITALRISGPHQVFFDPAASHGLKLGIWYNLTAGAWQYHDFEPVDVEWCPLQSPNTLASVDANLESACAIQQNTALHYTTYLCETAPDPDISMDCEIEWRHVRDWHFSLSDGVASNVVSGGKCAALCQQWPDFDCKSVAYSVPVKDCYMTTEVPDASPFWNYDASIQWWFWSHSCTNDTACLKPLLAGATDVTFTSSSSSTNFDDLTNLENDNMWSFNQDIDYPWLKIVFDDVMNIRKMKSRGSAWDHYVTRFLLFYYDMYLEYYRAPIGPYNKHREYWDQMNGIVPSARDFIDPIITNAVIIVMKSAEPVNEGSFKVELYGCVANDTHLELAKERTRKYVPLGMQSRKIGIGQIVVFKGVNTDATGVAYSSEEGIRLKYQPIDNLLSYWEATPALEDWLMVDLLVSHVLMGFVTTGAHTGAGYEFLSHFRVSYTAENPIGSNVDVTFEDVTAGYNLYLPSFALMFLFVDPKTGRAIKFIADASHPNRAVLGLEIIGSLEVTNCGFLFALELDGTEREPVSASSTGDVSQTFWTPDRIPWCPDLTDAAPWMLMDLRMLYLVPGLTADVGNTVTGFTVSTGLTQDDLQLFVAPPLNISTMEVENNTEAVVHFTPVLHARWIRFDLLSWVGDPCFDGRLSVCEAEVCPPQYLPVGNLCYFPWNGTATMQETAKGICESQPWAGPGRLVSPTTPAQFKSIDSIVASSSNLYWTSLVSGTPSDVSSWTWGEGGEPATGLEWTTPPADPGPGCAILSMSAPEQVTQVPCDGGVNVRVFCETDANIRPDEDPVGQTHLAGGLGFGVTNPASASGTTEVALPSALCINSCTKDPLCKGVNFIEDPAHPCYTLDFDYMADDAELFVQPGGELLFLVKESHKCQTAVFSSGQFEVGFQVESSKPSTSAENAAITSGSFWQPAVNSPAHMYVKVLFAEAFALAAVLLPGRGAVYVTQYAINYDKGGGTWEPVEDPDTGNTFFAGPIDGTAVARTKLPLPIGYGFEIVVDTYVGVDLELQFELIGCKAITLLSCYDSPAPRIDTPFGVVNLTCLDTSTPLLIRNGTSDFGGMVMGDYVKGFTVEDSYWMGLAILSGLTLNRNMRMRVDLWVGGGGYRYSEFTGFNVLPETFNYRLNAGIHTEKGLGEDGGLPANNDGQDFLAPDPGTTHTCPDADSAGWWYPTACTTSLLTNLHTAMSWQTSDNFAPPGSITKVIMRLKEDTEGLYFAPVNVAFKKRSVQKEDSPSEQAGKGNDGARLNDFTLGQCAGGSTGGAALWWWVDLEREFTLGQLTITGPIGHGGLANIIVYVGSTEPSGDPDVSTYDTCTSHQTGVIGGAASQALMCATDVIGRYVVLETTSTAEQFAICEIEIYPIIVPSKLYEPCQMNDDCPVQFSECTADDPLSQHYNFTCQCLYKHTDRREVCIPVADVVITINDVVPVTDTSIVRHTTTTIQIDLGAAQYPELDLVPVPNVTGVIYNFNLTLTFSDVDCTSVGRPCGYTDLTYDVGDIVSGFSDLQLGLPASEVSVPIALQYDVMIPAHLCPFVHYACITMETSYNSSYWETNWSDNTTCFDVTAVIDCQPEIDLGVANLVYITGTPIVRDFVLPLTFTLDVTYNAGTYRVVQLQDDLRNYEVHWMTSDVTFNDATAPLADNVTHVTEIAVTEAQLGLRMEQTITVNMECVISINMTECRDMSYLCFVITNHVTGSYLEQDLVDNAACVDVTTIKMCDPEMEVPVVSIDFPPDTDIVRGYNLTRAYNITLENRNTSLSVVALEPPDTNFLVRLYYTDTVLSVSSTPSVMVEMGVAYPHHMIAQEIGNSSTGTLSGEMEIMIPRATCEQYQYICVDVSPGGGSSYRLPPGYGDHIMCISAAAMINCVGKLAADFSLLPDPILVIVDGDVDFTILWDLATDAVVDVSFGDGTSDFHWDWLAEGHTAHYLAHNTSTLHSYSINNNYTVQATITNDVGVITNVTDIVVEPDLASSIEISVDSIPWPSPVEVLFKVALTHTSPAPVQLWCSVDFGDGNTTVIYDVTTNDVPLTFTHGYTTDNPDATADITCLNHVSEQTKAQLVILRADFEDVRFDLDMAEPAAATGDLATFSITMANGSHAQFSVDFGDGSVINYVHPNRLSYEEAFSLNHTYTSSGNYTVTVTASNEHFNATTNTTVVVMNPVKDLLKYEIYHIKFPDGYNDFTIMPGNLTAPPPDAVFCNWNDDTDDNVILYDANLQEHLNTIHGETYSLSDVTGETLTYSATCYNMASRQTLVWEFEVVEAVKDLQIVLDPPHAGKNEEVTLRLDVAEGSSVTYTVEWDDGENDTALYPQLFAGPHAFTHTYTETGNYTLTITASNPVSEQKNETHVYIVQHRVVDLILLSNRSELWPTGEMQFNITAGTTQDPLTDLHCAWDFQTGDVIHTYINLIDDVTPFYRWFTFPRSSVGVVDVVVNCSNLISWSRLNFTVEIILDLVILESFQQNGSVLWQNVSTFIIDVTRFGTYSCYQIDFGDGEDPVLYGIEHHVCDEYIAEHGYEFRPVWYNNLTITHEREYEWPGTYLVTLYAFNHVNNETMTTTHTVIDWPCYKPNVTFHDLFNDTGVAFRHMKSKTFKIDAEYTQYCWKTTQVRYKWSIVSDTTGDLIMEVPDNTTIYHQPRMLNYDLYQMQFYITMHSDNPARYDVTGVEKTELAYVRIIPTPLRVKIKGGLADGAAFGRTMEVNSVEVTFDLDTDESDKSGMEFMWFCKLEDEEWPMDEDWIDRSPPPGSGGCYRNGAGPMGEETGSFIIDTGRMDLKTMYHLTVEVSKDIRRGSYQQEFYVGLVDPPVMTHECLDNCRGKKRFQGRAEYEAICTDMCETKYGAVSATWRLFWVADEDTEELEEVPTDEFEEMTALGIHDMTVFIKPGVLTSGREYRLMALAETPGSANTTEEISFLVNLPPYDGSCDTDPLNGTAAETFFHVWCMSWKEWRPPDGVGHLSYVFRVMQAGQTRSMLFHSDDPWFSRYFVFPVGNPYDMFNDEVVLRIVDSLGDFWEYTMTVEVLPPMLSENDRAQMLYALANGTDPRLFDMLALNDSQSVTMMAYAMTSLLNLPPGIVHPDMMGGYPPVQNGSEIPEFNVTADESDETNDLLTFVRSTLLEMVSDIPVTSAFTTEQVNEVLYSLLHNPKQLTIESLIKAASRSATLADLYAVFRLDMFKEKRISMATDLLGTMIKIGVAADYYATTQKKKGADKEAALEELLNKNSTNATDLDAIDELMTDPFNSTTLNDQIALVMKPLVSAIHGVADSVLTDLSQNDPPVTIEFPEMTVDLSKESIFRASGENYKRNHGKIKLPKFKAAAVKETKDTCIERRMIFSQFNLYIWDNSADNMNSSLVSFRLEPCRPKPPGDDVTSRRKKREAGHDDVTSRRSKRNSAPDLLFEADEPFGMETNMYVEPDMVFMNDTPIDRYSMLYNVWNVSQSGQPVLVKVIPVGNETLKVFAALEVNPSPEEYEWNKTVPENATDPEMRYLMQIPGANLTNGSVYVGVQSQGCPEDLLCEETDGLLQYYISIQNGGCRVWDEAEEEWIFETCDSEGDTNPANAKFTSNLFGSFGAGLFSPPNTIDFGSVFDDIGAKLLENMPVVITVILVLIAYIPTAVFCRRQDKHDKFKWACLPLIDNYPGDEIEYEIHVYTGLKGKSGTNSNVFIRIYGTEHNTGVRSLNDGVRKNNFGLGETAVFLMTMPHTIGHPLKMRIWHDNSGEGHNANWYLSKVVVIDKTNQNWYVFQCEDWLSLTAYRPPQAILKVTRPDESDPNSLLSNNLSKGLYEDHIWLSVGRRKSRSTFTRLQRLSVCLVTLFLAMVCNAMWYNTGGDAQAAFSLGPISVSVQDLYSSFMSTAIMLPPVLLITTLFMKAAPHPKKDKVDADMVNANNSNKSPLIAEKKSYTRPRGRWPHWCTYIAWSLLALGVALGAFFTILYSFTFGGETSKAWLIAFILCFLQSLLVIQPLKVILLALLLTFLWKNDKDVSEYESNVGKMDEEKIKELSMTNHTIPDAEENTRTNPEEDNMRDLDTKMRAMMKELVFYVSFVFLLLVVVNGNQDENVFWQNQNLRDNFLSMDDVSLVTDIWPWLEESVLPELYYGELYNGAPTTDYDAKFLSNKYAMRLGPPRLRQLRVHDGYCTFMVPEISKLNYRCTQGYGENTLARAHYEPGWTSALNVTDTSALDNHAASYVFRSRGEISGVDFWGNMATYYGGGYVANLGNTGEEAAELVTRLRDSGWVDHLTRVVFLEFNVWNANTNLFNTFVLSMEFPNLGSMFHWNRVASVQLYRYNAAAGVIALFAEIALIIFVLVMAVLEGKKICKQRAAYFSNPWNVIQMCIIALFWVAFVCYVLRSLETIKKVEEMMNNREKSINFARLTTLDMGYLIFMGCVTFLAQLKMLYILRYNQTIAILSKTITESASDLVNFALTASFLFVAFTCGAAVLFNKMEEYSSLKQTAASMTQAFLGKFDFHAMMTEYGKGGAVYLWIYLVLMIFLVVNIFIVIINEFLAAVSADKENQPKDHEVVDHFLNTFKSLIVQKGGNSQVTSGEAQTLDNKNQLMDDLGDRLMMVDMTLGYYWEQLFHEYVEFLYTCHLSCNKDAMETFIQSARKIKAMELKQSEGGRLTKLDSERVIKTSDTMEESSPNDEKQQKSSDENPMNRKDMESRPMSSGLKNDMVIVSIETERGDSVSSLASLHSQRAEDQLRGTDTESPKSEQEILHENDPEISGALNPNECDPTTSDQKPEYNDENFLSDPNITKDDDPSKSNTDTLQDDDQTTSDPNTGKDDDPTKSDPDTPKDDPSKSDADTPADDKPSKSDTDTPIDEDPSKSDPDTPKDVPSKSDADSPANDDPSKSDPDTTEDDDPSKSDPDTTEDEDPSKSNQVTTKDDPSKSDADTPADDDPSKSDSDTGKDYDSSKLDPDTPKYDPSKSDADTPADDDPSKSDPDTPKDDDPSKSELDAPKDDDPSKSDPDTPKKNKSSDNDPSNDDNSSEPNTNNSDASKSANANDDKSNEPASADAPEDKESEKKGKQKRVQPKPTGEWICFSSLGGPE